MPKSKRNKAVTLSKTKKKGREHKENVVANTYQSLYVFNFENMRNLKFKEFRDLLKSSSRFFLGSNKVMQIALGRSASDAIKDGIHKISKVVYYSKIPAAKKLPAAPKNVAAAIKKAESSEDENTSSSDDDVPAPAAKGGKSVIKTIHRLQNA